MAKKWTAADFNQKPAQSTTTTTGRRKWSAADFEGPTQAQRETTQRRADAQGRYDTYTKNQPDKAEGGPDDHLIPSVADRSAAKAGSKKWSGTDFERPAQRPNLAMLNQVTDQDKVEIDAAKKHGTPIGIGKTLGAGAMMGVNEADAGFTKIARDLYGVSSAPLKPWNVTIGGRTINVNPINQANNALQKYVGAPLRDLVRKQEWLPSWMKPAPESEFDPNRDIIAETLDKWQQDFEGNAQAYQQQLESGTGVEGTVGRATAEVTKMAPQIAMAFLTRGASLLPSEVSGGTALAAQAAMRPGIAGLSGETIYQAGQDLAQMAPFGVQALGGYLRDAEQKGATPVQQWTAAVPQASLEVVTEMIPFGFMKKAFGITDDAFRAASKAGSKKALTYFGQLAKNQVYEAATEIVQEVGINPFTSAIEKAVYSPDMPWAGQGGVIDLQEAAETAKVTGVMSLMLAGLGLPVSAPGHIRSLRMLQDPATVTEQDVALLEDEVKTGTEQQADPVQATAAQMAEQLFPDAQLQVEQTVTRDVRSKQAANEEARSAIEAAAYSEPADADQPAPSILNAEETGAQDGYTKTELSAMSRYVQRITNEWAGKNPGSSREDFAEGQKELAEKLVKAIHEKDFAALSSRLHRMNNHSLRMFTEITGLSTKTDKETKESIRSLDPAGYDAWQEAENRAYAEKKASEEQRAKAAEFSDLERKRIRISDNTVIGYKEYINSLFAEGFIHPEMAKKGSATEMRLFSRDEKGTRYVTFGKKLEREYVQAKLDEYMASQAKGETTKTSVPSQEMNKKETLASVEAPMQETAQADEKPSVPESASPVAEKLNQLDEKLNSLIEAVSGKMELKGSESNAKEQPVSGEQLAVEGGGSASSEGSGKVRAASRKQEPGQPGADDGTAGNDGVRADGTGDAAETGSGSEQRPMGAPSAGGSRGSRKPRAAQSGLHTRNYRITPDEDVKKPFAHEAELRGVSEELRQVDAEMERQYKEKDSGVDRQDEDEVPDEFKGETPPELDFASEGGYIRLPGPKPKREGSHYRFADDEQEAQHEAARLTPASVMDKVKTWAAEFFTASTRTFRHVDPKLAKNSEFISAMVKYLKLKSMAGGRAVRILNDILRREGSELSVEEYNLFNRYILLRDLKEEVEAKHLLPGKWTPEAVEAYLSEVEGLLTDKTKEAIKRRDAYIKKIKDEYISAMGALGWNVRKRFDRKNYFRHQVLEYAQAKITGGGGRINVKRSRGWLKQRHGSKMLINEDYLQAEYEVMASMIHDTEVAKMIKDIGREYDIKAQLKRKAKAMVNAALQEIYDAEVAAGKTVTVNVSFGSGAEEAETIERSETEHAMMQFNKKMAIAFGKLQKSAENGSLWNGDGEWAGVVEDLADPESANDQRSRLFRYLAELAGTDGDDAISARTILKAVSDRKKATIDLLGDAYVEWDDIIPEGYVEFSPIIGRHFYAANAITENLANALMSGNLKELGLSDMKVRQVMVQGSPFNTFVIPSEYQATMEDVYGQIKNGSIDNAVAAFMKGWKMWQLHLNPWRFVKYNIRNATGDFEKLMSAAGIKGINPVYAKRAAKELFDAMRFNRFTPDLIEFRDKGGMQDNLYVQEIAAINDAKIFKDYAQKKSNVLQKVLQVPKTWDEFSSNVTEYRENILRYAAYLYYKEDLAAHGGKPSFYGASLRARIDGLKANDDKAYQLSKDALGAYDEISETGRWLRRYLIPFWSFQETNMKFYKRLVENTIHDDEVTAAFGKHAAQSLGITVKLSAKAIRKLGAIAIRVAFFSLALLLWNRLVMGDEDDDLDESIRDNPHLTLGRLPNGDVVYFSRLGSFSDILEWFNLNTVPNEIQDIAEGREDVRHLLEEMTKGPVNKIVNAMAPYLKVPAELLAGKTFYPDAFKPRSIRDLGAYAADQFGLGQEYDRLTGKPVKESYLSSWMNALVYRSDPEQAAYYTILDLKNRYRKNVLGEAPGEGFSNSPKSKALYYFKVALKYGDQKAADKYLSEYYSNGGTDKGLKQSLSTLDPLYGLDDAQRGGFYEWLRPQERTALEKAFLYYDETLGGGQ